MPLFVTSLFRKRLHRWFIGSAHIAFGLVVATVTNISAADEAGKKTMKLRGSDLPVLGHLPSLSGASTWLNSPPLDSAQFAVR